MMNRLLFPGLILGIVLTGGSNCSALDLVREGKPTVTVVSGMTLESQPAAGTGRAKKKTGRPSESDEVTAVHVLVEWIRKITDAELPIATAPTGATPAI